MSRKRLLEMFQMHEKYLDVSNWPIVKKLSNQEIFEAAGINEKEMRRLIKRCLMWDKGTDIIWGSRALASTKKSF
ncbi:hypothetical protein P4H71_17675 [Paenibacillus kribbensis]|uniref:hypothetical protein n=1 Tax=Paenibacillus kribbensis TaxID=172713 RepID=UPI002DBB6BF9|nr:hypothetical protein [Paenibacillus kribbensis]MEC0236154.1 hypothetical protein [Paenibacillus kribbensis]